MKKQFQKKTILIIKFGGLGDFFLSMQAFNAIRIHHFKDELVLLTEKNYVKIANKSGYFDKIKSIERSIFYFLDRLTIKKLINISKINFVYDLQTSKRSSSYIRLFYGTKTQWSGIAKNCSHPHKNSKRNFIHTNLRLRDQLKDAGIKSYPKADLNWITTNVKPYDFRNYAILIPGGSKKRKYKRIPIFIFNEIIKKLLAQKIKPILIGSKDDESVCKQINKYNSSVINLCSKLDLFELAILGKKSKIVIGNDTGPMHLMAQLDCLTLSLFTKYSDPILCGPQGKNVKILNVDNYDLTTKSIEKIINNC